MHQAALWLLGTLSVISAVGCDTSCGKRDEPILWAEGITTTAANGVRSYATTPVDSTWLHFPSYRRFRLPHGLSTKEIAIETRVSLAVDSPASDDGDASKFAVASSGEVLATIEDENTVIVENATCENNYYVFVTITERVPSSQSAP